MKLKMGKARKKRKKGKFLKCEYCKNEATRCTPTSDVYLCYSDECAREYISDECKEFDEEDDD